MPVSAEGRVEHQKLKQTKALMLFGRVFGAQLASLESVPSNGVKPVRHRLVEFLVFDSIHQLKGVPPDAEKW